MKNSQTLTETALNVTESNHVFFTCFHSNQKENTPSLVLLPPKSNPNSPISDVRFAGRADDIEGLSSLFSHSQFFALFSV